MRAVARALLAKCSKAHSGISFITHYIESFVSSYSNAEAKKKNEARQCPPLLLWQRKRHSNIQYDANAPPTGNQAEIKQRVFNISASKATGPRPQ